MGEKKKKAQNQKTITIQKFLFSFSYYSQKTKSPGTILTLRIFPKKQINILLLKLFYMYFNWFYIVLEDVWEPSGIIPSIAFLRSGKMTECSNISSLSSLSGSFKWELLHFCALLGSDEPSLPRWWQEQSQPCSRCRTHCWNPSLAHFWTQTLWPTCAQGEGALCDTWETKKQRHKLDRQHHSIERVQPRQDVQCLKAREVHGGWQVLASAWSGSDTMLHSDTQYFLIKCWPGL